MSELLPPPPQEMIEGIKRTLRSRAIHEIDQLPDDFIGVIASAAISWFYTPQGSEIFNKMFGMRKRTGQEDHRYFLRDGFNNPHEIKHDDVVWFYTLFVKGQPAEPGMLEEEKRPVLFCDGCGMGGHCPKDVFDPVEGKTKSYCNHCLNNDQTIRVRQEGDSRRCYECPVKSCDYHPERSIRREHLRVVG